MRTLVLAFLILSASALAGCTATKELPEVEVRVIVGPEGTGSDFVSLPVRVARIVFEELGGGEHVLYLDQTVNLSTSPARTAYPVGKLPRGGYGPLRVEFGLDDNFAQPKSGLPFRVPSSSVRLLGDAFTLNGTSPVTLRIELTHIGVTEARGIPSARLLGLGTAPVGMVPEPIAPPPPKRGVGTLSLDLASATDNHTLVANFSTLRIHIDRVRFEDDEGTVTRPVDRSFDLVTIANEGKTEVHTLNLSAGRWKTVTLFLSLEEAVLADGTVANVSIAPGGRYDVGTKWGTQGALVGPDLKTRYTYTLGVWQTEEIGMFIMSRPDLSGNA